MEKIQLKEQNLAAAIDTIREWKTPESVKREVFQFLNDGKIGRVNVGHRLVDKTLLKYLYNLKTDLGIENLVKGLAILDHPIKSCRSILTHGEVECRCRGRERH